MIEAFTEFSDVYYQMYRLKEEVLVGAADARKAISLAAKLKKKKQEVFATFGEHPQWFLGSSVKQPPVVGPRAGRLPVAPHVLRPGLR